MMLRASAVLLFLCAVMLAQGQTFQQYLKLRKQYGITQAVGIPALETFVGKRVMEVKGTVSGTFTANGRSVILLNRSDGEPVYVQTDQVPDWLAGNLVDARILIRAERESELEDIRAWLIGAAPEADVADFEGAEKRKAEAEARRILASRKVPAKPKGIAGKDWSMPASEATAAYANFIRQRNPRLTQAEANKIATGIVGFSIMYGVDARLIMAMVMAESGFNPDATSYAGAMGLGQLMPGTARGMGLTNAYDSIQNLYGTVRTIRGHLERYGKKTGDRFEALLLSLAAYNAGSGNVRKHKGIPPFTQTQNYIRKVISYYEAFIGKR